jgi:CHC2 zinc finger
VSSPNDFGRGIRWASLPHRTSNQSPKDARRAKFVRDRLPDWTGYAARFGITLIHKGKWRSVLCPFHDDHHPSMRVNTESGGWVCMSCGVSGGDVLAFHMARHGMEFMAAARALGAVIGGAAPAQSLRPSKLSARDGLELLYHDALLVWVAAGTLSQGFALTDGDRADLGAAMRRILIVREAMP